MVEENAVLVLNRPRSAALKLSASMPSARRDSFTPGIACHDGRFIAAIPEHPVCASFLRHRAERFERRSATNDQSRADLSKLSGERRERLMQPPTRRAARLPRRFLFGSVNEQGDDGAPSLHGCVKRRIVCEAKIVAKPDDGGSEFHYENEFKAWRARL